MVAVLVLVVVHGGRGNGFVVGKVGGIVMVNVNAVGDGGCSGGGIGGDSEGTAE